MPQLFVLFSARHKVDVDGSEPPLILWKMNVHRISAAESSCYRLWHLHMQSAVLLTIRTHVSKLIMDISLYLTSLSHVFSVCVPL